MSSVSLSTKKSPFVFDVKYFFLGQKKENLGPYLYSNPNPEIENDLVYGEKYYQKLIYEVPDYYLYKDEVDVIKKYADSIANYIPLEATVIEFGPGTEKAFITKTLPLLKAIEKLKNYVAVDLCQTYLDQTKDLVEQEFNEVTVQLVKDNFFSNCELVQKLPSSQVVWFKGSTLGNITQPDCVDFLQRISQALQPDGILIVGLDSNQDEVSLRKAYDNEPVAKFITNIFERINRDCEIDNFDPKAFTYHFEWNEEEHCVKHQAIATESQSFTIDNTPISIKKGDLFHVTSSYKYPTEFFQKMAINTGFKILDCFIDNHKRMAVYVLQASRER